MLAQAHSPGYARQDPGGTVRKTLFSLALPIVLLLAACPKTTEPLPPGQSVVTEAPTDVIVPTTATETPTYPVGTTVIGDCPIIPEAVCTDAQMSRSEILGADLHGADLSGANLSGSDLRKVNLRSATLVGTNLRNTDLSGSDLSGADLTGAKLRFTNVSGANLEGANMKPTQLAQVQMCRTIRPDGRRDDSDCAADPNGDTTTSETGPTILTFTMPDTTACTGTETTVQVSASWTTKKAKKVTLEIDGKPLPADQVLAKNSTDDTFDFTCKKHAHTYTLVATSADGAQAQKVRTVKRA